MIALAPAIVSSPSPDAPAARPLRILMVVESAAGGTGRHVLDLSEGLLRRGHEVHLVHSTRRIDRMFQDRLAQLPSLHRLPLDLRTSPHPADLLAVCAVRRYLRRYGPFDLIHGHSSKGGAIARLAALFIRVPAFYTLHGLIMMDPGLPRWKKRFYAAIELALAMRTAGIIAVSPEEARAATRLGLGHSRVAMIPNGVGPAELPSRSAARAALGLRDDQVAIGFVGRLVEQKAPHVLLQAFAHVASQMPSARLVVVGDGPLDGHLRALSVRLGIDDRVLWLGERDAREVLSALDVFALPSRKEGLPYVVLEAMSAGLPVVATASAGVEVLVTPGLNGAVVPTNDSVAFGSALSGLVRDARRRRDYGAASLARAASFTIDAMVERTCAVYRRSSFHRFIDSLVH